MDSKKDMHDLFSILSAEHRAQEQEKEEFLQRLKELPEELIQTADDSNGKLMTELYLIGLLERVQTELQECRVFVTTEERAHPVGCEMYDELLNEVSEAVEAYRGGRWQVYVQARTE